MYAVLEQPDEAGMYKSMQSVLNGSEGGYKAHSFKVLLAEKVGDTNEARETLVPECSASITEKYNTSAKGAQLLEEIHGALEGVKENIRG